MLGACKFRDIRHKKGLESIGRGVDTHAEQEGSTARMDWRTR